MKITRFVSLITAVIYLITSFALPVYAADETEEYPLFYAYKRFDQSSSKAGFENWSNQGGTISHSSENGGSVHYLTETGSTSKSYTDVVLSDFSGVDKYIVEADITPISITGSSYIGFFDSKDDSLGKFRSGARFNPNGKILMYNASNSGVAVGSWKSGETTRMSLCYNLTSGLVDVYINGVCTKSGITCSTAVQPNRFRIDMAKSSSSGKIEFYVDNIRIYSSSALLPPVDSGEYTVYSSRTFTDLTTLMASSRQGGTIEYKKLDDGREVGHFYVYDGETSGSYLDTIVPGITGIDEYVIEATVTPNQVTAGSIGLFDSKDGNGSWRIGARFNTNKTITVRGSSSSYVEVGTWSAGVAVKLSLHYNFVTGLCNVYINGNLAKAGIEFNNSIRPHVFRIDLAKSSTAGNLDFYVDDIHIYSGYDIRPNSEFEDVATSIMDFSMVPYSIGTASVFTVDGKYYFSEGVKREYESEAQRCVLINDVPHIPFETASTALSMSKESFDSVSGVTIQNGTSYAPAEGVADILGKYFMYDERGFFVLSDSKFKHVDSVHFINMYETIDLIYRYIMFDNPTGEQFLADFDANIAPGEHPRIMFNREEIDYIKSQTSPQWQAARKNAVDTANTYLTKYEGWFSVNCIDDNKQSQATNFQTTIENLAAGYLISGDEKYAKKGIEYMKILAQWETLGFEVANLTTGHWAMGMAVGYDSFYDCMTNDEKAFFKEAFSRLPFNDTIRAYGGGGGVHWITIRDNFMGVIGGGMMALLLAVADEEDMRDEVATISADLVKSLEIAVTLFYPNGGYFEGAGYSEYMLSNLCKAIEAMFKCCGTDYGFEYAMGFTDAGHYFPYIQSSKYRLNYSDCGNSFSAVYLPYWFGYRYGETATAKLWYHINNLRGSEPELYASYFVDKGIGFEASYENMPLDAYYPTTEAGTFRNTFNSTGPVFAGIHGGWNGLTHDMLDLGEFVFESDGTMWAIDLGGDNYSLPSYFGTAGYKIYRKNPEGENCVVINPADNVDQNGSSLYYGQKTNAFAPLTLYQTAPRAAMAAYDLTEAYERDVDSYVRGYYFGDDRNTFQIQDEIQLKDTSELYWFMHTRQNIEIIDNNTARITSPSSSLRVEVYCEGGEHTLKVMEAKPLPTSPVVEGQSDNVGVTKLAVHMPNANGNVQISVKLIPENTFYTQTPVNTDKISQWSIPDGDIQYPVALSNPVVGENNLFSAEFQVPDNTEEIKLYIDDKFIRNVDVPSEHRSLLPATDLSLYNDGSHVASIEALKSDGTTDSASLRFEYKKNTEKVLYASSLTKFSDVIPHTGWRLSKTGTKAENGGEGLTLVSPGGGQVWLDYRASNSSYTMKNKISVVDFDVEFSSTSGHFEIECKSVEKGWFFNDQHIFDSGKMINGIAYESGRKYNVKLILNFYKQSASIYIDNQLAKHYPYIDSAVDNSVFKLQYSDGAAGSMVTYTNFSSKNYYPVWSDAQIDMKLSNTTMESVVSTDSFVGPVTFVVAYYKGSKTVSVQTVTEEVIMNPDSSTVISGEIPENWDFAKAYALDTLNMPRPVARVYYYKNHN